MLDVSVCVCVYLLGMRPLPAEELLRLMLVAGRGGFATLGGSRAPLSSTGDLGDDTAYLREGTLSPLSQ